MIKLFLANTYFQFSLTSGPIPILFSKDLNSKEEKKHVISVLFIQASSLNPA